MRFRLGALPLVLVVAGMCADAPLTPAQRQLNIDSFEQVWKTVREKHWDPNLNGVDWQAVHDELRPKVEKAATMPEARAVMSDMLSRLKQTHFGIVPGDAYKELDQKNSAKDDDSEGDPGLDLRIVEGHALVTFVRPESPAATKGVKPGWEIMRVDGKDISNGLRKMQDALGRSTVAELETTRAVMSRLEGPLNKSVSVEFKDAKDHRSAVTMLRVGPRGQETAFGKLPPLHFWLEAHKVQGDIGYVQFNMFFEPDMLSSAMQKMMSECASCKGFIIDLRGNPGGIGAMAMGLAGWFTSQNGLRLGTMYLRAPTKINFAVFPRPEPFTGPLAILVDANSASTSEVFAGGMQDLKRARIFGTRTAGAALPSMFERLPNGDGFQYAIANYISEGGKQLEGNGVIPDEEVKLTRHQLLEGEDPVVDAAANWIHGQKK